MFSPNAISPSNPCLLLHHQPQKHVFPIVSAESQARSFPSENFRSAWQFQSPLPGLRRDSFQFNGTTIQRGFNRMTSRHRSTALSFIRTTNDLTLGLAFARFDVI